MSAQERSNWRDEALSARHRLYGADCPALDLDLLLVEFDRGIPCGIIEYKHEAAMPVDLQHPSYRALAALADASRIPFCIVFYASPWVFTVYPANTYASEWFTSGEVLTELRFVERLYRIRGRDLPPSLQVRLNDVLPQEALDAA